MGLIQFLWFRRLSICEPWKFVFTNSCMYFPIYPIVNAPCGELFIGCCSVLHPDLVSVCYHYTVYSCARVLDLLLYRNRHCTINYDLLWILWFLIMLNIKFFHSGWHRDINEYVLLITHCMMVKTECPKC
jgi:hypothetical protein